jgi:hypothetical protein
MVASSTPVSGVRTTSSASLPSIMAMRSLVSSSSAGSHDAQAAV